jgi:hypothetical protein
MAAIDATRRKMIRRAVMQLPDVMPEVSIDLWIRLARELSSIVGDGGFKSLYLRSVHLTKATFSWIELNAPAHSINFHLSSLKDDLAKQDYIEACEASIALLITFLEILDVLIGRSLTIDILRLAWGRQALSMESKKKQSDE